MVVKILIIGKPNQTGSVMIRSGGRWWREVKQTSPGPTIL